MSSQENSVNVSEEVKQLVADIMTKNNLKGACKVKYYPGSELGDGYTTKTYAVDIINDERSLNLFLKCALNVDGGNPIPVMIYEVEIHFYKTIYPKYKEFIESKGVKDGFQNVPVCYGFNETKGSEILALENLRKKGFTLFNRFICMNDEHLTLTLQAYAKFHAVSFALKDQRKKLHDEFCDRYPNILSQIEGIDKMISKTVKSFIEKLDSVEDKDILDRCDNLDMKIINKFQNFSNIVMDYGTLTKGDSWVNNMMILYENDDLEHPKDIMLVDWQGVSRTSPILDLEGLFYSVASEEAVRNYKYYMQIYHDELSRRIRELGSDPEVLYPLAVFEKEWTDCGLFSLGMCLAGIKMMLTKSKDAPSFEYNIEKTHISEVLTEMPHDEKEYLRRTKYIVRHMIDIGII